MDVLRPPARLPSDTAACIGAFDGMHLGHLALLEKALEFAPRVGVVTFEPRPAEFLAPDRAPARLQSIGQRERVCRAMGVDALFTLPFDAKLATLAPAAFVDDLLVGGLRPAGIVVGEDFRYGRGRTGDVATLRDSLARHGVPLGVVSEQRIADGPKTEVKIGSTRIREIVESGDVGRAAEFLGRWYAVEGVVSHGDGRGRSLGFPTANVTTLEAWMPRVGVYAAWMSLRSPDGSADRAWPAVANLGTSPTFTDGRVAARLEVHALDRDLGDSLYGKPVEVHFVARLRDEARFEGADALINAIGRDITAARGHLAGGSEARCHPPQLRHGTQRELDHG